CRWERAGHGGGGGGAGAAVQELTPAGVVAAGAGRDAIDVRNAVDYHTPGDGENANGDVQVIGKPDEPVRLAVAVGVFEDHDGVARLAPWQGREGILHGLRYPESAAVVEIHVDRFGAVRHRPDQLDGEARRQVETFLFLQRCPCRGGRDERPKGSCWHGEILHQKQAAAPTTRTAPQTEPRRMSFSGNWREWALRVR